MPAGVRWTEPRSLHLVWVTLRPDRPRSARAAARDRGVAYARGELFHVDGRGAEHLARLPGARHPDHRRRHHGTRRRAPPARLAVTSPFPGAARFGTRRPWPPWCRKESMARADAPIAGPGCWGARTPNLANAGGCWLRRPAGTPGFPRRSRYQALQRPSCATSGAPSPWWAAPSGGVSAALRIVALALTPSSTSSTPSSTSRTPSRAPARLALAHRPARCLPRPRARRTDGGGLEQRVDDDEAHMRMTAIESPSGWLVRLATGWCAAGSGGRSRWQVIAGAPPGAVRQLAIYWDSKGLPIDRDLRLLLQATSPASTAGRLLSRHRTLRGGAARRNAWQGRRGCRLPDQQAVHRAQPPPSPTSRVLAPAASAAPPSRSSGAAWDDREIVSPGSRRSSTSIC